MINVSRKLRRDWNPAPESFERLLKWLDGAMNSEGQRYLEIRRRLIAYFNHYGCLAPEELADQTLDDVMRRLEEEGEIQVDAPERYIYIRAKFVLKEFWDKPQSAPFEDFDGPAAMPEESSDDLHYQCLEQCLNRLSARDQEMVMQYYIGDGRVKIENRRSLCARWEMTEEALRTIVCRLRKKLRACMGDCVAQAG